MSDLTAVLMAGGASRRMGRPKALLDYGGEPMWKHQLRTLAGLEPAELLISGSREVALDCAPCEVIFDDEPGLGPVAGLQSALARVRTGLVVVLAVDMPGMTTDFLREIVEEADPYGVVPELDGYYQGLAAVYPAGISPLVDEVLAAGEDRSFQHLMRFAIPAGLMKARNVTDAEKGLFGNLNTVEDLEAARAVRR